MNHKRYLGAHDTNGMCSISKFMEGGSLNVVIQGRKKIPLRDALHISIDMAEGILFLNNHGILHKDLNTERIFLDKKGNATIADIGLVHPCKILGEVLEYKTSGYKWIAPEFG